MAKKVLFIDRDGTIVQEPNDFQVDSFDKLSFLPGVISTLSKIARELDFELVMVSNQDGLGTASFPEAHFLPVQRFILDTLKNEGVCFADVYIDRTFDYEQANTRKPNTGMLSKYIYGNYDLKNSYVIGDRITDVQLAKNLGAKSIFVGSNGPADADLVADGWPKIYRHLSGLPRTACVQRQTSETDVFIELNLDGYGEAEITTGLPFFDHMLQQLAKHGDIDLRIVTRGDLRVDEHHTIEDTAIALGEAFRKALGTKKGTERYGFLLPMDDCLAQVAIDFGGRPWLSWEAVFKREKIGDFPTEMCIHFFKSFSDHAQCTLHMKAEGDNEHHKIEAIFKAFAKAVRSAVSKTNNFTVPSTKGTL